MTAATTDRFICSLCGLGVSKQMAQHAHLRVRRDDGTGWDHARCRPRGAEDALRQRRAERGLR